MPNLTQRWPLGLNRKNWPDFAAALAGVLFVLVFFDAYVSQTLMAWPDAWKAPFAFVTDFGLSEWVLIPSLIVLILSAIVVRLLPQGLYRRATHEAALVAGFIDRPITLVLPFPVRLNLSQFAAFTVSNRDSVQGIDTSGRKTN